MRRPRRVGQIGLDRGHQPQQGDEGGYQPGPHDRPHALNAAFNLERFAQGATIDEKGAGPYAWAH